MRHKIALNKLGKKAAHRKAMLRNMLTALFRYERIRTTQAKASVLRPLAEKMITRARVPSLHNRRLVARDIQDKAVAHKLFTDIAPRFISRPGGYTRILKLGMREDSSEIVLFELVERSSSGNEKDIKKPKKEGAEVSAPPNESAKKQLPAESAAAAEASS